MLQASRRRGRAQARPPHSSRDPLRAPPRLPLVILSLVRLPLSRWLGPVLLPLLLAGCETFNAATPPAPPASDSIALLYQRPAERALINGLRAYEEGSFERAEQAFRTALLQQLRDRRDTAIAHKYLAFIACAFNRLTECEQQFRNAFAADPNFLLTDAEIGHPIWGPVYRRVSGQAKR